MSKILMNEGIRPRQVFDINGVRVRPDTDHGEITFACPECGKRLNFNLDLGTGHCFHCDYGCNDLELHARWNGLSMHQAVLDILEKCGKNYIPEDGVKRPERVVYTPPKAVAIASPEALDRAYTAFLNELGLSDKHKAQLAGRGFTEMQMELHMFRTFPRRDEIDYVALCKRLQSTGVCLTGVPGFFRLDRSKEWTFTQVTKGIITPVFNRNRQIVGLQIRKDDDLRVTNDEGELEQKCCWFSSKGRFDGCRAKASVHYGTDFAFNKDKKLFMPVLGDGVGLTEGIMKSDLITDLRHDIPCIGVAGVNAINYLREELIYLKSCGVKKILILFDMDYISNVHVQKAVDNLVAMLEELGFSDRLKKPNAEYWYKWLKWDTRVKITSKVDGKIEVVDGVLKGFDDYEAYKKLGIVPHVKTVSD